MGIEYGEIFLFWTGPESSAFMPLGTPQSRFQPASQSMLTSWPWPRWQWWLIPLCLVEAWVNLKWRNLWETHADAYGHKAPGSVRSSDLVSWEVCLPVVSAKKSVFFPARLQGYEKNQQEPLPLRVRAKGETQKWQKEKRSREVER